MEKIPRRPVGLAVPGWLDRARIYDILFRCYREDDDFSADLERFHAENRVALNRDRLDGEAELCTTDISEVTATTVDEFRRIIEGIDWFESFIKELSLPMFQQASDMDSARAWLEIDFEPYRERAELFVSDALRSPLDTAPLHSYLAGLSAFGDEWGLDRLVVECDLHGLNALHQWFMKRCAAPTTPPDDFARTTLVHGFNAVPIVAPLMIAGEPHSWEPNRERYPAARKRFKRAAGETITQAQIDSYLRSVVQAYWNEGWRWGTTASSHPQFIRDVGLLYRRLAHRESPLDIAASMTSKSYKPAIPTSPFTTTRDRPLSEDEVRARTNELVRRASIDLPPSLRTTL